MEARSSQASVAHLRRFLFARKGDIPVCFQSPLPGIFIRLHVMVSPNYLIYDYGWKHRVLSASQLVIGFNFRGVKSTPILNQLGLVVYPICIWLYPSVQEVQYLCRDLAPHLWVLVPWRRTSALKTISHQTRWARKRSSGLKRNPKLGYGSKINHQANLILEVPYC